MRRTRGSGTDEQNRREGSEGAFASALTQRLLHSLTAAHCSLFRVQSPPCPPPFYCNSCSNCSKMGALKNSVMVMFSPSQSFLTVITDKSLRVSSIMLYTVDGVTPDRVANSLYLMFCSLHSCWNRWTIACLIRISISPQDRIKYYAQKRIRACVILGNLLSLVYAYA